MPRPLIAPRLAEIGGLRHGFFTREGGVSQGIYAGLNVGLGSRDDRDAVLENRRRVAAHLGFDHAPVNTVYQVHSADAVVIDQPFEGTPPQADALVTRTPGLIIGALAADCCPILLADPQARIVAAVHAGWRGAVAGVVESTIAAMERLGADRAGISAAIGPTISQAAYEVGFDFEERLVAHEASNVDFFTRDGGTPGAKPRFDLPGFVERRLQRAGVRCVESLNRCTYTNESDFYSFRRATHRNEPDYGRQISAIVLL